MTERRQTLQLHAFAAAGQDGCCQDVFEYVRIEEFFETWNEGCALYLSKKADMGVFDSAQQVFRFLKKYVCKNFIFLNMEVFSK